MVSVNCHLSEISEMDVQKTIVTPRNSWSIYSVTSDNCDKHGDLESAAMTIGSQEALKTLVSDSCECNGLIDLAGGGECRLRSESGSWWCYVNSDSSCPDSTPDSVITKLSRSSTACSKGVQRQFL